MTALYQNSELTLVQCKCHIGKQTAIARINPTNRKNCLFYVFNNFLLLSPNFKGGQMPVLPRPVDAHANDVIIVLRAGTRGWGNGGNCPGLPAASGPP